MQTTAQTLSDPLLQQVGELIERRTGLHFPRERFMDLERGLVQAAREVGGRPTRAYVESLFDRDLPAAELETLAGSLTVGETHFFRDPRFFAFLESSLLPELIAAKRGGDRCLRLWSAGCATGEEPYSLAILLHRLLPDPDDWRIAILGTDINPKALARASAGIYSEWSFRDTPDWVKPRYFAARSGNRHEIVPWLKRRVSFACLNLADDVYPSILNNTNAMDLIVCRNVLLYFAPARMPPVVRRFHRALVDGGRLVLGAVEAAQTSFPGFTPVPAPGVALYWKNGITLCGGVGDSASVIGRPATLQEGKTVATMDEFGGRSAPTAFDGEAAMEPVGLQGIPKEAGRFEMQRLDSAQDSTRNAEGASPDETGPGIPNSANRKPPSGLARAAAQALYAAGRYSEARATLLDGNDRPRDNDPRDAMLLAQCHANLGELVEALLWCERGLAAAKTDPELHFLRAGILQELQDDDAALAALRNVLFLAPGHVPAHFALANLHRRHRRLPAAEKHLAHVRRLLAGRDESEEVPQSGGLTVGRMSGILAAMAGVEGAAHD